jgi:hypothetical protein
MVKCTIVLVSCTFHDHDSLVLVGTCLEGVECEIISEDATISGL